MNEAISLSSLTLVAAILMVSAYYSLQGIFTSKISAYAVPKQQQQQQYQLNNTTTTTTSNTMRKPVLHVNKELAKGNAVQNIQQLATEIEDQIEEEEMLQTASPMGNINSTNNTK